MSAIVIPFPLASRPVPLMTQVEATEPREALFLNVPDGLRLPERSCFIAHETNIREIYISTQCPSVFLPSELDVLSRRNVDALRGGKITPEHFTMAIEEIETQLKMKAEADPYSLPIEHTATFQYFSEWKKANGF